MLLKLIFAYVFTLMAFMICFVAFVFVTRGRRPIDNILAWLFFIFLLPYIGIPLFLVIGQRKLTWIIDKKRHIQHQHKSFFDNKHRIQKLLSTFNNFSASDDNEVELLTNGMATYHLIIKKIATAKHSILISTYRITNDEVGNAIVKLLTERAKQGVQICLLLDTIGTLMMFPRRKLKPLRKAGGNVRFIMPLFHTPFRGRVNLRDHRKIMVFDGTDAIVGGMNLAKDYMGPNPYSKRWNDLNVLLRGSVVQDLIAIFESDWVFAASRMETKRYQRPEPRNTGTGTATVQAIASGPDIMGDPLYDAVISSIYNVRDSLYIITPYFILDEALQKAFTIAIRRGVEVNIIIPRKSNHRIADLVRSISIRKLCKQGAKLWLHKNMIHAKAMIFDHDLAIIGSANLDQRSLLLNFEISCFLYSEAEISMTQDWAKTLLRDCSNRLPKTKLLRMWLEDAAQLLKPLL